MIKSLQRLTRRLLATLKKQIAAIDMRMVGLIAEDQTLTQKAQKLTAIAGVGTRTAVLLLARMPELGSLNRTQAAALVGLAPFNSDSGTLRGKHTIFGGRRALRCGLYMAALVAARHNRILSDFYRRLRGNGKPHKAALTAVMRNLLITLNHT
jgi:transposase